MTSSLVGDRCTAAIYQLYQLKPIPHRDELHRAAVKGVICIKRGQCGQFTYPEFPWRSAQTSGV